MPPFRDLTGQKFGKLTALTKTSKPNDPRVYWNCLCECGNHKITLSNSLGTGNSQSCGCSRKKPFKVKPKRLPNSLCVDKAGNVYGHITVLKHSKTVRKGSVAKNFWICKCVCGDVKEYPDHFLYRHDKTISCGCMPSKYAISKDNDNSACTRVYQNYRQSASKRDFEFSITLERFRELTKQNCIYCGLPPYTVYRTGFKKGTTLYLQWP